MSGDEDSDDDGSVFGGSEDEGEDNKNKSSKKAPRKASRKKNSIPWNEIPLEASGLESTVDKADHERMVNYRKAAEEVQRWLNHVDKLNLPPNPLDKLLNELGGPDEVAELTGRKVRQVKVYDAIKDQEVVILEKRKGDGPMDQINIEEKNHFQESYCFKCAVCVQYEVSTNGLLHLNLPLFDCFCIPHVLMFQSFPFHNHKL